jgi:CubicO group peptidase (beta-lactamase class C family)
MTDLRSRWILLAFCLVALVLTVPLAGQDLPTAKPEEVGVCPEKVQELSTFMQSLVDQGQIAGGVTMMARHGKVIHLEAVGMADREEKEPMRTDSIFRIASMTKPITSVAIMMLWEQGKLDLDDPVSKYIPEFKKPQVLINVEPLVTRPAKREMTIRHLLTHTSGLGYTISETTGPMYLQNRILGGLCSDELSLEDAMKRLGRLPLRFDPGEQWYYSMSTDVLGRVVEVASGLSLDEFIEERLCGPLGMSDTFFRVPHGKRSRLVAAYLPDGGSIRRMKDNESIIFDVRGPAHGPVPLSCSYCYDEANKYLSGGAGLCSTAPDYWRFCQMLLNGGKLNGVRLLQKQTVEAMTTNQVGRLSDGFGLGFGVLPDKNDVPEPLRNSYHWGGFWSTSFRIAPRGNWTVIAMAQTAPSEDVVGWADHYERIAAEAILK